MLTILLLSICSQALAQNLFDSSWKLSNQHFELHLTQNDKSTQELNSKIVISRNGQILIVDSLSCSRIDIVSKDINSDGVKDILVYESSGVRSNKIYSLFLYRKEKNDFIKVSEFNQWPNIDKTEIKGILSAMILTGNVEYKFFKLLNSGKLIDLNISEIDEKLDGKAFAHGLKQVKQKLR